MKIKYKFNKDKLWFTSDTHFCHENILMYCNRPFKNVVEMNNMLIQNWNNSVKPDDDIIIVDYQSVVYQRNPLESATLGGDCPPCIGLAIAISGFLLYAWSFFRSWHLRTSHQIRQQQLEQF